MKKTLSQTNKDLGLRRFGKDVYSKALGEGGGGEITADDITPELLENEDVLKRIRNWGLSDEEVADLPLLSELKILDSSGQVEDLLDYYIYCFAKLTGIGSIDFDGDGLDLGLIGTDAFKYIKYASNSLSPNPIVLYREYYDWEERAEYTDFSGSFRIIIKPNCLEVYMGVDTL